MYVGGDLELKAVKKQDLNLTSAQGFVQLKERFIDLREITYVIQVIMIPSNSHTIGRVGDLRSSKQWKKMKELAQKLPVESIDNFFTVSLCNSGSKI
jgi:hypothetical protein